MGGTLLQPWPNAFGMRKYFKEDYLISLPKLNKHQKKKFFTSNWSVFFLPKLGEDQKNGLRRKLKRFFAKIRWRIRSFSSDHLALKSRWGDAKSRWGDASPLQFRCWPYPNQKFWVRQWIGDRLKKIFEDLFFWRTPAPVSLVLGLGLEHSYPWSRECLSLERLSLALASDFFCVLGLGLGLEPCVLDSTSDHYEPVWTIG